MTAVKQTLVTALMLAWASCGTKPIARGGDTAPALVEGPHSATDRVVARVNGTAVWQSCVTAMTPQVGSRALDECIDFELLAQAALAQGAAPRATPTAKRVLADAMVRTFEREIDSPNKLPRDLLEAAITTAKKTQMKDFDHPEIRQGYYVRVRVPKSSDEDGPADRAARDLAHKIHAALANRRDWFPHEFIAAAQAAAGADPSLHVDIPTAPVMGPRDGAFVPTFANALFAISNVGAVSPPTKVRLADRGQGAADYNGWDILLLADILPANTATEAEVAQLVFPAARRAYFKKWMDTQIAIPVVRLPPPQDVP